MTARKPDPDGFGHGRVRRNKDSSLDDDVVIIDDEIRGFPLPDHPSVRWCALTRQWWEMWRKSPQGKLMVDTDWWSLLETAIIHNELFRIRAPKDRLTSNGLSMLASELARRQNAFGATWESRRKNRLVISSPHTEEQGEEKIQHDAAEIVDYFEKLQKEAAKKIASAEEAD